MSQVTELGYLGLSISNVEKWKAFACGIVGMEFVDEGEKDRFYLRMDQWHHRITLHVNGGDDMAYMGLRVAGPNELAAMAQKLATADIVFQRGTEREAAERRVMGLLKTADPAGHPIEIFWGPQVDAHKPFHPGRPMFGRFLTGDQGMGHILVSETDLDAATRFYEILGFVGAVEYQLALPNGAVAKPVFMHCNKRQHTVAFGLVPGSKRINHLMIEYTNLKDIGIAHDLMKVRNIPITKHLGMHVNDGQLSFYPINPSEWAWELGWGGREALSQQEYYINDYFGHEPGASGYGLDIESSGVKAIKI
jgi:2,3-dihydroxyethylbenzene 1,2-dioxygenase